MTTCDKCGAEFSSGGVSVRGIGTFCGWACYGLALEPKELNYFRCRYCKTVRTTTMKSTRPQRCKCSGSWMTYLYTVPIETDEQRALAARGVVDVPHAPVREPWICHRCGESNTEPGMYRPDGKCCLACYHAESRPLLTPEEQAEKLERKADFRRKCENAQDLVEQEQSQ